MHSHLRARLRPLHAVALGVALFVAASAAKAEDGAAGAPPAGNSSQLPLARTFGELWQLGQERVYEECRLQARFHVLCYYPEWKVLWVMWDGQVHYVDSGARPLPLVSGRSYDLDGYARTLSATVDWERTRVTPVMDDAKPKPMLLKPDLSNLLDTTVSFVEVDALVDYQSDIDGSHNRLHVMFGEHTAAVFVPLKVSDALPNFAGAFARITGVLSVKRDTADAPPKYEIWCTSVSSVVRTGSLDRDPRFERQPTLIEALPSVGAGELVRVVGTVHRQEMGRAVTVRDATGQVTVLTKQVRVFRPGDTVEAIGHYRPGSVAFTLSAGLVRSTKAPAEGSGEAVMELRLAEQVRSLRPEDVRRGMDARITGIVTWTAPASPFMFMQDASGGLKVMLAGAALQVQPVIGTGVIAEGRAQLGDFVPELKGRQLRPGANVAMPDPIAVSLDEAMTGVAYGRWVEMQGFVRSMTREGQFMRLELTAARGEFEALAPADVRGDLPGAIVQIRGVCDALSNDRRQLRGIRVLMSGNDDITIIEPAPADPFGTRRETVGDLMRYNAATPLQRRVQVSGVVLLHRPGEVVYLQDGSDTMTVLSRQTEPMQPGDRISVVGIPGQRGGRLIMREAVYRRDESGKPPAAVPLPNLATVQPAMDGRLVRVTGTLINLDVIPGGHRLQLQHDNVLFSAFLTRAASSLPEVNSRLELTGVYGVELDEYQEPRGFLIRLRSAEDIFVLAAAPWWTATRVIWAIVVLLSGVVVVAAWGVTVVRKNRQLTLAEHKLRRANEQLEARVEERTRDLKQEVEQRRASEALLATERMLLRTLIDNLPVFLYVKDLAGRFVIGNLPLAHRLGAKDAAEVIGRTEADFLPAEIAEQRQRSDEHVMRTGTPLIQHEELYMSGDTREWHSTTKVPLRDVDGTITGLIAISQDITDRKSADAERENLNRQLLDVSRRAGMAEVATGVLHNVGNVLNSVNISASLAAETLSRSKADKVSVVVELLMKHRDNLGDFFANDPRAPRIAEYLAALAEEIRREQDEVTHELQNVQRNVEHIKEIVAMQQTYAKVSGVTEVVTLQDIAEDALRIQRDAFIRHQIDVVRDYRANPTLTIDRHKVLQILVNLLTNAKHACDEVLPGTRRVIVVVDGTADGGSVSVVDNGIGIPAENMTRIFSHGFTTKKHGHGFGLHSGALAAAELGGELTVASGGQNCGATFTLRLPSLPSALKAARA